MSTQWEIPEPTIADVMNGLTLGGGGGGRRRGRRHRDDDAPAAAPRVEPEWPDGDSPDAAGVAVVRLPDSTEQAAIVRPYAWTRGRTRSTFELRLETMVSAGERAGDATAFAESEHRAIGELCREPRSVAEVATLLGAPLGVAKVLLGDMAQLGLVTVHKTASGGANKAHLVLMERVLSGLRRL